MNENLNLKEILKGCPAGTKFYSTVFGYVYFEKIDLTNDYFPIKLTHSDGRLCSVTNKGWLFAEFNGECTLFPDKNQRDWSKWQRPFVDGDIIHIGIKSIGTNCISIYKHQDDKYMFSYIDVNIKYNFIISKKINAWKTDHLTCHFATEEEKQRLFDVIKTNGYKWNPETKTLEKLIEPKFKVGDKIKYRGGEIVYRIVHITENSYVLDNLCSIPISIEHMYKLVPDNFESKSISPKFKVGDKITEIGGSRKGEIFYIDVDKYHVAVSNIIGIDVFFEDQDKWELIPDKFDPNTLIPFESKVLVRDGNHFSWVGSIYTHRKENGFYTINGTYYRQCIPYNDDTSYLIGTYREAPKYYKYWEK